MDRSHDRIVIMGVSGAGKTTVGKRLAETLNCRFADADDFHPLENVRKMASGLPLDDNDRYPWLLILSKLLERDHPDGLVLACSALKAQYREILSPKNKQVRWVFLEGDFETLYDRIQLRNDHFMPAALLKSQFETLEIPDNALHVSVKLPLESQIREIIDAYGLMRQDLSH